MTGNPSGDTAVRDEQLVRSLFAAAADARFFPAGIVVSGKQAKILLGGGGLCGG